MDFIRTPATPFQKCEIGNFILRTFLKIFADYVTCYKTVIIRRPDWSVYSGTSLLRSPTGLGKSDLNEELGDRLFALWNTIWD